VKLVLDTNTIISGSLWQGPAAHLLSAALGDKARIFFSLPMLLELRETLQRPRFAQRPAGQGETPESITARFRAACHEGMPAQVAPPDGLRDLEDLHVLACAAGVAVDAIVSGDQDLLDPGSFEGIPILTPVEASGRLDIS
jgi:putative PIN family toxin of toxin-antitoxin system